MAAAVRAVRALLPSLPVERVKRILLRPDMRRPRPVTLALVTVALAVAFLALMAQTKAAHFVLDDPSQAEDALYMVNNIKRAHRIPPVVHLVFGLADDFAGKPWTVVNYLAVMSAKKFVPGAQIKFYYRNLPQGPWWTKTRPLVELVKVRDVPTVFDREVHYTEHKGDVIRLEALLKHGGVYIDSDTLILKDLTSLMEHANTTAILGYQQMDPFFVDQLGLCNAIILAEPRSVFIRRWYEGYQTLDNLWDQHSVRLPKILADLYPLEVQALPVNAFFWPSHWDVAHIWEQNVYDFSSNYAMHLWASGARRTVPAAYAKYTDMNDFCTTCSTISRMARHIMGKELRCDRPCTITVDSDNPAPVPGRHT